MRVANGLLCTAAALTAITLLGCGTPESDSSGPAGAASQRQALDTLALSIPTLNTFILDSIEIDQLGAAPPQDANLFVGADPADGTASAQKPTGGPATFIDWDNLKGDLLNHRIQDLNDLNGTDPTSFPSSNECVGTSNVLSKMDLTYVAAANNEKWAYFAVQRSNNNGDAGYYWLFTKLPPKMDQACSLTTPSKRLMYDISVGDVLLGGHFQPGKTALLSVYKAVAAAPNITAVNAINFQNTALWAPGSTDVYVAVNTTVTAPDSLGVDGVLALINGNLDHEIFAEAAVPVSVFTGGQNCGAEFYGSVITRSSGSGGTSPDLKDLAGPAKFNFGKPVATAAITTYCDGKAPGGGSSPAITYAASATSLGKPIANPTCAWKFVNAAGTTVATASGCATAPNTALVLPAGDYTATVTVTDALSSLCAAETTSAPFTVYPALGLTATVTGSCQGSFDYSASPSGGSGTYAFDWQFGSAVTPQSSLTASGTAAVSGAAASFVANLTVKDTGRADGLVCDIARTPGDSIFGPTTAVAALVPSCDENVGYGLASATGGAGTALSGLECHWVFDGVPLAGTSCAANSLVLAGGSPAGALHTATVTVKDPGVTRSGPGCEATDALSVRVYTKAEVGADLGPSCVGLFTYAASPSGGSGNYGFKWEFSNGAKSELQSGSIGDLAGNQTYSGTVTVTDTRSDDPLTRPDESAVCVAVPASDNARVFTPIKVDLALGVAASACPMSEASALFNASPSGGSGSYALKWNGVDCVGTTCLIDPAGTLCNTQDFTVTVADLDEEAAALCGEATSNEGHYKKFTLVEASVGPAN